jgi:pyridoxine 4-dehydrogenase
MNLFDGSLAGQVQVGGVSVNRIGLGTNRVTDTPEIRQFLQQAVRSGVNFIDTAHIYSGGDSETGIGNALAPFPPGLVVATKGGMQNGGGTNREQFLRANLEESLQKLKTDRITLYQLHRVDDEVPIGQTMELFKKFQAEGKIEHVGLSEVTVEQLEEARQHVEIVSVQNQYSLSYRTYDDVLDYCTRHGIIFIPWFPLRDVNSEPDLQARLQPFADKYNVNPQQIALAWLLKKSPVMLPIPGTLSFDHLKENVKAAFIELSDEDFAQIDAIKS